MNLDDLRGTAAVACAAAAAALALLPAPAHAQESGARVLRTAVDRYEARLDGIRAVTVVQRTTMPMGTSTRHETRLVKSTREGHAVLVPEGSGSPGEVPVAGFYSRLPAVAGRAVLRERERVDGRRVWVVAVPDLSGIDFGQAGVAAGRRRFRADSAVLYLDADRYLLRRARMYGQMTMGGTDRPVSVRAEFTDYRDRSGYVYPFRTEATIDIEGLDRQMQALMERMKASDADSARRAAMEQAVAAMVGGGMTVSTTVEELRVEREGDPDGG